MSATEKQGLISGDQNGAGGGLGHDPGTIRDGAMPEECEAVAVRAAARRAFQEAVQGIGAEEGGQEVAQLIFEENWYGLPVEEEDEEEVEEEVEEEDEENEDDKEEGEEMEEGQEEDGEEGKDEEEEEEDEEYEDEEDKEEEEEVSSEKDDTNYADREEEEDDSSNSSLFNLKLGYFPHHLLVPKPVSFFNKEATEYKYEGSDEKAQETGVDVEGDENEEPEKGPEVDVD